MESNLNKEMTNDKNDVLFEGEFNKGVALFAVVAYGLGIVWAFYSAYTARFGTKLIKYFDEHGTLMNKVVSTTDGMNIFYFVGGIVLIVCLLIALNSPERISFMRTDQQLTVFEDRIVYAYTVLSSNWRECVINIDRIQWYNAVLTIGKNAKDIVIQYNNNKNISIAGLTNAEQFIDVLEKKGVKKFKLTKN